MKYAFLIICLKTDTGKVCEEVEWINLAHDEVQ